MRNILNCFRSASAPHILGATALAVLASVVPDLALAQYYNGPGIVGGIQYAQSVGGISGKGARELIVGILLAILAFMGLAAVVVIVIAGIMLVVSLGDETAKDKAKKIILYAVVGLIVIALSAAIVAIIANATGMEGIFGPIPNLGDGTISISNPRQAVLDILKTILSYMALIAVVVIVIAGIMLVVSMGEEGPKDRAKKIIFYAIVGLLIILFASAIVGLVDSLV